MISTVSLTGDTGSGEAYLYQVGFLTAYPSRLVPGAYTFSDYVRVGTPLNIVLLLFGVWLIPLVFPF